MIEERITIASTINIELWSRLFGLPPRGIVVIIDPQVGQRGGQLRSMPLLAALGIRRFTFSASWRGFDLVPYEFVLVNQGTSPDALTESFPICQLIGQEVENQSPSEATRKLLQAYSTHPDDSLLIYVLDSERFYLHDSVVAKSFIEEFEIRSCILYERLFNRYLELEGQADHRLPSERTMNLMLHKMLGKQSLTINKLRDLFTYRDLPPDNPAWDVLEQAALLPQVRSEDLAIHRLLRVWVESDITKAATNILEALQSFDYDISRIRAHRDRLRGRL